MCGSARVDEEDFLFLSFRHGALVVEELDVDILTGTPFMALNDISVKPSLQQISIQGSHILYYGAEGPDPPQNHVRRT